MYFDSFGPFEYPREKSNHWEKEFWDDVDSAVPNLSSAIGCYAFCIENGERVRPWYVGKTLAQKGFRGEVFTDHKLKHYANILGDTGDPYPRRGRPSILLFALVTENWTLSQNRSSSASYIDWLEKALIGMALAKNPEIANKAHTRFHNEVYVNGVIGSQSVGRPNASAKWAKKAFLSR